MEEFHRYCSNKYKDAYKHINGVMPTYLFLTFLGLGGIIYTLLTNPEYVWYFLCWIAFIKLLILRTIRETNKQLNQEDQDYYDEDGRKIEC